jgi:hypothetical protein
MAEKSRWDQAKSTAKTWRNRKKISQIIKDYFYLPFFFLIILWPVPTHAQRRLLDRYLKTTWTVSSSTSNICFMIHDRIWVPPLVHTPPIHDPWYEVQYVLIMYLMKIINCSVWRTVSPVSLFYLLSRDCYTLCVVNKNTIIHWKKKEIKFSSYTV